MPQPMLSHAGEDGLLIGTYYGHHNSSSELNGINLLHNDKWLTYEVVREILEGNPQTFYGLGAADFDVSQTQQISSGLRAILARNINLNTRFSSLSNQLGGEAV